jgi:hydrogenase nickel incorporation protein HypA/HybF
MLTEIVSPVVLCPACGVESEVTPANLRCPACASGDTRLLRGDELILARVELDVVDDQLLPD